MLPAIFATFMLPVTQIVAIPLRPKSGSKRFRHIFCKVNKEAGKTKFFQSKFYFLNCPITIIFFLPVSLSLTLLIFVFSTVDAMLHISGLLKLSRFNHMWTLHSGTFRRLSEQVIAKH